MTVTKATIKDLLIIFAIEILTVPLVITYFKFIEPKKLAAVIAASTFVITGFIILRVTRKWPDAYASFVYWAVHIHIFVFSIPMLVARIAFWEKDFSEIKFLYFTGPQFHSFSEKGYLILMIGTLVDILVHAVKLKRLNQKKETTEKRL
ncbi:MAG: hypothetical protein V4596_06820 [Bdellovibrionota bacterium]